MSEGCGNLYTHLGGLRRYESRYKTVYKINNN